MDALTELVVQCAGSDPCAFCALLLMHFTLTIVDTATLGDRLTRS